MDAASVGATLSQHLVQVRCASRLPETDVTSGEDADIGARDERRGGNVPRLPKTGMTTLLFHAYQQLPASGNDDVLSLPAQHPTATVRSSLSADRAANARLFLDG